MSKYFEISGYWKDTLENFEDYIVKESEEVIEEEDEDIFYYGLGEEEIKQAILEVWGTDLEFIITDYKEIML